MRTIIFIILLLFAGALSAQSYHHGHDSIIDLNVLIAPQIEHWPSQYVPYHYRLPGYQKAPEVMTCQGQTGRSIGTHRDKCPPGQNPQKPAKEWSTSPD